MWQFLKVFMTSLIFTLINISKLQLCEETRQKMPDKLSSFPSFLLAERYYSRIFITMQPTTTSGDFLCISDVILTLLNVSLLSTHRPLRIVQTSVLRIQTILIRIRILLFTLIRIQILLLTLIRIRIRLFDTDLDPSCFKEAMYLKRYFLYVLI
jgi:hypothetical protein